MCFSKSHGNQWSQRVSHHPVRRRWSSHRVTDGISSSARLWETGRSLGLLVDPVHGTSEARGTRLMHRLNCHRGARLQNIACMLGIAFPLHEQNPQRGPFHAETRGSPCPAHICTAEAIAASCSGIQIQAWRHGPSMSASMGDFPFHSQSTTHQFFLHDPFGSTSLDSRILYRLPPPPPTPLLSATADSQASTGLWLASVVVKCSDAPAN